MYAKLSKELTKDTKIALDFSFVTEFMPYAPENYVKVYLAGLALASSGDDALNTDAEIARSLGIDPTIVGEAFAYWSDCGVVNLLATTPPSVEYLPITGYTLSLKKFSKTKYKDFNDQLHAMLPGRNVLPAEYNEYYSFMETMHMEPAAMLAVIAYSIRQKGEDVSYKYILAVARNLAHQGCLTYDRVNEQLTEFDLYDKDLLAVFSRLGLKRAPALDDKRMFGKWTVSLGFSLETVIKVAGSVKKGGMERLDALLTKYYENRLTSYEEIEEYENNRQRLMTLAKNVNRKIGVYYEQLDAVIETYLVKWIGYGFDDDTLLAIAEYCFKRGVRTLEGLNETVEKFYRQGLLSLESINSFMSDAMRRDEEIRKVLDAAGVNRPLTSRDRDSYRTWTYVWKMPVDVILYAAGLSAGSASPLTYLNAILAGWHNAGITDLDGAKKQGSNAATKPTRETKVAKTYTSDQLNAMFDNLDFKDL